MMYGGFGYSPVCGPVPAFGMGGTGYPPGGGFMAFPPLRGLPPGPGGPGAGRRGGVGGAGRGAGMGKAPM